MDLRNHVLDRDADAPTGRGTFRGMSGYCKAYNFGALVKRVSCAKMGRMILTTYTLYDVLLHKELLYRGCNVTAPPIGVESPKSFHLAHEVIFKLNTLNINTCTLSKLSK